LSDDKKLMRYVKELSSAKKEYDKIKEAFASAKSTGYGIVQPDVSEMVLSKPEPVRRGADFGVKLKASAPCYHIFKVEVGGEITPSMGSEERSEEFLNELLSRYDDGGGEIWDTELFGKNLKEVMNASLSEKALPEGVRKKLSRTVSKIVNDGKGNLICFVF